MGVMSGQESHIRGGIFWVVELRSCTKIGRAFPNRAESRLVLYI